MNKFTIGVDQFKFGVIGLYNTKREKNFYKVVAHVGGAKFVFNTPDWEQITQLVWKFVTGDDIETRPG